MHHNLSSSGGLSQSRERLVRFLVEGQRDITEEAALCRLTKLGITNLLPLLCVAELSLHLDVFPADKTDELLTNIEEQTVRYLNRNKWRIWAYVDSRNSLILLLSSDKKESFVALDGQLGKLVDRLMNEHGIVIYAGIGRIVSKATEIKNSAADAASCIAYKYLIAEDHVIHIKNLNKILADTRDNHTTAFERVIGCFLDGDMEKLRFRLNELLELLKVSGSSEQAMRQMYIELITQIVHRASDVGVVIEQGLLAEYMRHIMLEKNISGLRTWFELKCQEFIVAVENRRRESSDSIAREARKFVEENYADHDLSQQSVSDFLGLSLGYFGHLFYSQTGQRFVDYLNSYRLEKAGDLLKTGNGRIMDISAATGFNSVNYFNVLFKKHYKVTPKEYRQKYWQVRET